MPPKKTHNNASLATQQKDFLKCRSMHCVNTNKKIIADLYNNNDLYFPLLGRFLKIFASLLRVWTLHTGVHSQ